jgi:hypothetical protein
VPYFTFYVIAGGNAIRSLTDIHPVQGWASVLCLGYGWMAGSVANWLLDRERGERNFLVERY